MFHFIPPLYAITDFQLAAPLTHAEQASLLIEGGVRLVQLREKRSDADDFFDEVVRALQVARERGARIIVNDRADIALAARADGVHLGQTDMPPEAARRLLGEKAIVGFSTHNLEQARAAAQMPIDYLAVGPVFATRTKENPDETVGLDGVRRVRDELLRLNSTLPLVAIGGITIENARQVLAAGADSVAIVSALVGGAPESLKERARRFVTLLDSAES